VRDEGGEGAVAPQLPDDSLRFDALEVVRRYCCCPGGVEKVWRNLQTSGHHEHLAACAAAVALQADKVVRTHRLARFAVFGG
jgi:hypothetical protein